MSRRFRGLDLVSSDFGSPKLMVEELMYESCCVGELTRLGEHGSGSPRMVELRCFFLPLWWSPLLILLSQPVFLSGDLQDLPSTLVHCGLSGGGGWGWGESSDLSTTVALLGGGVYWVCKFQGA
ncbi:hypothetical protein Bca4012_020399 [Brassica carinata]